MMKQTVLENGRNSKAPKNGRRNKATKMMKQRALENGRWNKATKKGRESKLEVLAAKPGDVIIVSFDTHKKTYHPAVWKNGALAASWVMPADNAAVVRMLEPAREALAKVVYEAGPTGYSLARALQAVGFPVGVAAPGKTPRAPNQGDRKSTRLNSSHTDISRMPSSA